MSYSSAASIQLLRLQLPEVGVGGQDVLQFRVIRLGAQLSIDLLQGALLAPTIPACCAFAHPAYLDRVVRCWFAAMARGLLQRNIS